MTLVADTEKFTNSAPDLARDNTPNNLYFTVFTAHTARRKRDDLQRRDVFVLRIITTRYQDESPQGARSTPRYGPDGIGERHKGKRVDGRAIAPVYRKNVEDAPSVNH
jgi:hypothetical protein